jgi:hypothetical protein
MGHGFQTFVKLPERVFELHSKSGKAKDVSKPGASNIL